MPTIADQKIVIRLQDLQPIYWGALALGGLLVIVGFASNEYGYLIAACFLGIVARILQAEHQFRTGRPTRGESGGDGV